MRLLLIGLNKQVVPRTGQGLFQAHHRIDRGIFGTGFNFLNEPPTQIGFFGQAFLGQFGSGTKAADILAKNNMRCPLHPAYGAVPIRVESEL